MKIIDVLQLHDELKSLIFHQLQLKDYTSTSLTCKKIYNLCQLSEESKMYWKNHYKINYSISPLKGNNSWKERIELVEMEVAKKKKKSDKLVVYANYGCELLGTLRPEIKKLDKPILNDCLNKIIEACPTNHYARMHIASCLIDYGANPLVETNVYLNDYPLKLAVLNNDAEMVALFLKRIPTTHKNIALIQLLIRQYKHHWKIHMDLTLIKKFCRI